MTKTVRDLAVNAFNLIERRALARCFGVAAIAALVVPLGSPTKAASFDLTTFNVLPLFDVVGNSEVSTLAEFLAHDCTNFSGPAPYTTYVGNTDVCGIAIGGLFEEQMIDEHLSLLVNILSVTVTNSDLADPLGAPGVYTETASISSNGFWSWSASGLPGDIAVQVTGNLTEAVAVPEPETWALILIGFASWGYARYRRVRV